MMGLVGIAGIAAIVGGAIYIFVTVGSLLLGQAARRRRATARKFTPISRTAPSAAVHRGSRLGTGFAAPGTFTLAMVFLVAFVLYYFINWKYLSQLWGLS